VLVHSIGGWVLSERTGDAVMVIRMRLARRVKMVRACRTFMSFSPITVSIVLI